MSLCAWAAEILGCSEPHTVAEITRSYHHALKFYPASAALCSDLGSFFFHCGQAHFTEALSCYKYALQLNPEMVTAMAARIP